jgi:ATP-dependent Clp protease ATP-binding subunit ClpA
LDATRRSAVVVRILSCRTKNNPVLIGEPGVGKTDVVEGLVQHVVRGDIPRNMLGFLEQCKDGIEHLPRRGDGARGAVLRP